MITMNDNTIFIQIASYRDPELIPTIRDCISNADFPENLKFCICWQKSEDEILDLYLKDPRFIILSIPYKETKGCCWARNKIQQFYNGEKYTLQLDSHHRFIKGWDTILIDMLNVLQEKGNKKPIITAYVPSYNPENDPQERVLVPWKINFDKITEDGQILFRPSVMNVCEEPMPAKFYSAHFAFTIGEFCKEVQHDPELYFTGEEMNITIRAFTHGYNLFHPNIVIVWHEYTRKNRVKHWDDDKEWWKKDVYSKKHYLNLFKNIEQMSDRYGLGKERSLQEYIDYSNIDLIDIYNIKNEKNTKNETNLINTNIVNIYKQIDESWEKWIQENIQLGVDTNKIKDILLNANFDPEHVNMRLNIINI